VADRSRSGHARRGQARRGGRPPSRRPCHPHPGSVVSARMPGTGIISVRRGLRLEPDRPHADIPKPCAYSRRLVASSTTAISVCRAVGRTLSQACGLPSRCSSSPKHARGSRRRRYRPRARPLRISPAACSTRRTNVYE
jgi:hypothetical protein